MSLVSPLSCSAHPLQPTYLFFCLSDARQFHSSMVKLCSSIDIVVYILTKFFGHRDRLLTMEKDNLRSEPKHIVFLSQLLLLFSFCHSCKTDNPLVETREVGTKAVVTTICSNVVTTSWSSLVELCMSIQCHVYLQCSYLQVFYYKSVFSQFRLDGS